MATSAFGKAFAAARKAGQKTFEFNGKKYHTRTAEESEQPSVGGKAKPGEYKTRAPYSDRGRTMMEDNYVRRDMKDRMDVIDRETLGDEIAMKYTPRRDPEAAERESAAEMRRESRGMKSGGVAKGWGKARGARKAKMY